jgi:hypothetical protein
MKNEHTVSDVLIRIGSRKAALVGLTVHRLISVPGLCIDRDVIVLLN